MNGLIIVLIGIISLVVVGAVAVNGTKPDGYTVCDLLKRCCGIFGKDGTWCHGCTELSEEIFTVKKEA